MASDPRVAEHVDSLRELFDIDGAPPENAAASALAEGELRVAVDGPPTPRSARGAAPPASGARGGASPRHADPRPQAAEDNGVYARQPSGRPAEAGVMAVANPAAAVSAAGLKGA
jgi:glutamyl-tRNA reductase